LIEIKINKNIFKNKNKSILGLKLINFILVYYLIESLKHGKSISLNVLSQQNIIIQSNLN